MLHLVSFCLHSNLPLYKSRNIHFYVNRCGFHIVEFFNEHHPYEGPDAEDANELGGAFRFQKIIE